MMLLYPSKTAKTPSSFLMTMGALAMWGSSHVPLASADTCSAFSVGGKCYELGDQIESVTGKLDDMVQKAGSDTFDSVYDNLLSPLVDMFIAADDPTGFCFGDYKGSEMEDLADYGCDSMPLADSSKFGIVSGSLPITTPLQIVLLGLQLWTNVQPETVTPQFCMGMRLPSKSCSELTFAMTINDGTITTLLEVIPGGGIGDAILSFLAAIVELGLEQITYGMSLGGGLHVPVRYYDNGEFVTSTFPAHLYFNVQGSIELPFLPEKYQDIISVEGEFARAFNFGDTVKAVGDTISTIFDPKKLKRTNVKEVMELVQRLLLFPEVVTTEAKLSISLEDLTSGLLQDVAIADASIMAMKVPVKKLGDIDPGFYLSVDAKIDVLESFIKQMCSQLDGVLKAVSGGGCPALPDLQISGKLGIEFTGSKMEIEVDITGFQLRCQVKNLNPLELKRPSLSCQVNTVIFEILEQAAGYVIGKAEELGEDIAESVTEISKDAVKVAHGFTKEISAAVKLSSKSSVRAIAELDKFFGDGGRELEQAAQKAEQEAKELAKTIVAEAQKAKQAAEAAGKAVTEAAKKVEQEVQRLAEEAKRLAEQALKEAEARAKQLADEAKRLADKAAEEAKRLADQAANQAKNLANSAESGVKKAGKAAKKFFGFRRRLRLLGLEFETDESALDFDDEDDEDDEEGDLYWEAFLAHLDSWDHGGVNSSITMPYLRALQSEAQLRAEHEQKKTAQTNADANAQAAEAKAKEAEARAKAAAEQAAQVKNVGLNFVGTYMCAGAVTVLFDSTRKSDFEHYFSQLGNDDSRASCLESCYEWYEVNKDQKDAKLCCDYEKFDEAGVCRVGIRGQVQRSQSGKVDPVLFGPDDTKEIKSWSQAGQFCVSKGFKGLASTADYCDTTKTKPIFGIQSGNQWAPSSDYKNNWVQVGNADGATCKTHKERYGVEQAYGEDGIKHFWKANYLLCAQHDTVYFGPAETSSIAKWSQAATFCTSKGFQGLAPAKDFCNTNMEPIFGTIVGQDQWSPIGDYPNGWLQVGTAHSATCRTHRELFGKDTSEGEDGIKRSWKANYMLCKGTKKTGDISASLTFVKDYEALAEAKSIGASCQSDHECYTSFCNNGRCKVKCSATNRCFPSLYSMCFASDGNCLNVGGVNHICDKKTDSCTCDETTGECAQEPKKESVVDLFPKQAKELIDIETAVEKPGKMLGKPHPTDTGASPCKVGADGKVVLDDVNLVLSGGKVTTAKNGDVIVKGAGEVVVSATHSNAPTVAPGAPDAREKAQLAVLKTVQDIKDAQQRAMKAFQNIHNNIHKPFYIKTGLRRNRRRRARVLA